MAKRQLRCRESTQLHARGELLLLAALLRIADTRQRRRMEKLPTGSAGRARELRRPLDMKKRVSK